MADGGTLFLDEIGELPLSIQAKLLRAIQEGEIQRLGSEKLIKVNVRLLTATNRNLETEVEKGRFREDSFSPDQRLSTQGSGFERAQNGYPGAGRFFCEHAQKRLGPGPVRINSHAMEILKGYAWPDNVRELENILPRKVYRQVRPPI